jgi:hypothetical protein
VYDDVLRQLIEKTEAIRATYNSEVSIVWAVHFPPTENCGSFFKLVRSDVLEDAAEANSVQLVMAGHLHRNVEYRTRHGKPILCAGTIASSGGDSFNWLHVVEIEVDKSRIVACEKQDYRWDDTEGDFVPTVARQISLAAMV